MTTTTVETGVRDRLAELAAAMRAKDADRVAACYRPGAEVFELAPPLRRTFDPDLVRSWFAGHPGDAMDWELSDPAVTVAADLAVAHGLARMGVPGIWQLWFRATVVLREVDGRWLVEHLHTSTPFHMDGADGVFRAATDLTP
jgi:ketosteroid isomerase-like protein